MYKRQGCGRTTSTFFQELAQTVQEHVRAKMPEWKITRPGAENLTLAVMGCVVNGPGESRHANIGISLPGTGEAPACLLYTSAQPQPCRDDAAPASGPASGRSTRQVLIGKVAVGGAAPVVVQSMTNTDTADVAGTAKQIAELWRAGSELVRVTVNNPESAAAVPRIVDRLAMMGVSVPIIGDFHLSLIHI